MLYCAFTNTLTVQIHSFKFLKKSQMAYDSNPKYVSSYLMEQNLQPVICT